MNTRSGMALFKNFRILLDSGNSSTIVMANLISKLKPKQLTENRWETQSGKFTASQKVNVDLCLLEFSGTNIVSWKFHADSSLNIRYNVILCIYLLTALGLYIKFSGNIMIGGDE